MYLLDQLAINSHASPWTALKPIRGICENYKQWNKIHLNELSSYLNQNIQTVIIITYNAE